MNKHKVHTHFWDNGILKHIKHEFDTLVDALHFSNNASSHATKVYNADGELVHATQNVNIETYA